MERQLAIIKPDTNITILPDNNQWKNRFEIKSETSNRLYVIAQSKITEKWGCSCPGWIIHRKCKHLKAIEGLILQIEQLNKKELK